MIFANLMVSVFVEPIFHLLVSFWTLAFVIAVEFLFIWRVTKNRPVLTLVFVVAANVISTGIGSGVLWITPGKWHVITSQEQLGTWRVPLILLGYALCFVFSCLIESGVYRVLALKSATHIQLRVTAGANALSYALTPLALWLYAIVVRTRY